MASDEPPRLARRPLMFSSRDHLDLKDPCPVRLGHWWHLFGTGSHPGYRYDILHATAPHPAGPWRLRNPSVLPTYGSDPAGGS